MLPKVTYELPFFCLGCYDPETCTIHLNIEELTDDMPDFFKTFLHELMHHIFNLLGIRGKIDLDDDRLRFFNWEW